MKGIFNKFSKDDEEIAINITSMIDVIFILLIFFMVSTQFKTLTIPMELPQVEDAVTESEKNSTVNLAANGSQLELEGQIISLDELEGRLKEMLAANSELAVCFSGDKSMSYQEFLEVYVIIENAGISKIAIEHDPVSD
ncbi:MAG: biopolymer transporter ExbD [Treponemataceae bacterium]|nr:biopolymer transporter ExbD [Treponemataceae bacterium]